MSFDWTDYLVLAEQLATRTDVASKRTAISRAYYFVFNIAFVRAESTAGRYPGKESTHNWCWQKFQRTQDSVCRQLGNDGQRMKRRRVKVDYKNDDIPRLDEEVQRMLQEARQFQRDLRRLSPQYPSP